MADNLPGPVASRAHQGGWYAICWRGGAPVALDRVCCAGVSDQVGAGAGPRWQ